MALLVWLPVCTPSCNGGLQYWQTINSTGNCAEAALGAGDCELFKLSACSVVVSLNRCQRAGRSTTGSRSWINSASYNMQCIYLPTHAQELHLWLCLPLYIHISSYVTSWFFFNYLYIILSIDIHTCLLFQWIFLIHSKNL